MSICSFFSSQVLTHLFFRIHHFRLPQSLTHPLKENAGLPTLFQSLNPRKLYSHAYHTCHWSISCHPYACPFSRLHDSDHTRQVPKIIFNLTPILNKLSLRLYFRQLVKFTFFILGLKCNITGWLRLSSLWIKRRDVSKCQALMASLKGVPCQQ